MGAASAAYSSIAQGIGNAAYFGDAYSLQKLAFDTALGAATAGLLNGAGRGVQYLKGKWGRAVPLGETPQQTAKGCSESTR